MYFNLRRTLSYNALFNIIIGGRGIGKTYACKEYVLKKFLENGAQFIYLRRYGPEIERTAELYFADVLKDKYPNIDLEYQGGVWRIDGKVVGYALPLTQYQHIKSASFPTVETIIFEEFIIDTSGAGTIKYLRNEPFKLLDIYETIARSRSGVRLFMLANAISISNPYFLEWNITLPAGKDIARRGKILIQNVQPDPEFVKMKMDTEFGQLSADLGYSTYSVENEFYLDAEAVILPKDKTSYLALTFEYNGALYGIWTSESGKFIFSQSAPANYGRHIAIPVTGGRIKKALLSNGMTNAYYKRIQIIVKSGNYAFEDKATQGKLQLALGEIAYG